MVAVPRNEGKNDAVHDLGFVRGEKISLGNFRVNVGLREDVRFGPKVCQIGTKWDKSDSFSVQISAHLGSLVPISEPFRTAPSDGKVIKHKSPKAI